MKFYWEVYYVEEIDEQLLLLVQRDSKGRIDTIIDYTPDSDIYTDLPSYHKTLVHSWEDLNATTK